MTNLEAKQEAIKKAYGEYWDKVKDYVDENGWCNAYWKIKTYFQTEFTSKKWRPKSLKGIENNNGWIKIESEADLPKENIKCFYILEVPKHYQNAGIKINIGSFKFGKNIMSQQENYFTVDNFLYHRFPYVTHYQPIEKPKPPIF